MTNPNHPVAFSQPATTDRRTFLGAMLGSTAAAATMASSSGLEPTSLAAGRSSRRWHDLMAVIRGEEVSRREGYGADLVAMIEESRKNYRDGFHGDCVEVQPDLGRPLETAEAYAGGQGDEVIYDGLQVVAILRPQTNGELQVIRL